MVGLRAEATRGFGWSSGLGGAVVGRCSPAVAVAAVDVLVVREVGEVRHGEFCVLCMCECVVCKRVWTRDM